MVKSILLFLLEFILLFNITFAQKPQPSGSITFIGNEGFMLESNGKKVFIDALYYSKLSGVQNTSEELRQQIINARSPFDNSLLFLVTHAHDDHFNKDMVTSYLKINPQSLLIAPSEIVKTFVDDTIKDQLIATNPDKLKSTDTIVNEIKITTFNLVHKLKINIYNVGYFIDIDSFKVFHAGDNVMDDTTEFVKYRIDEKKPDVALLNYTSFWQTEAQRSFVKRYINPRLIIIMHIPVDKFNSVKDQVKKLQDNIFPPVVVLSESLEKVEISDSIYILSTGIKGKNTGEFRIFPNPCNTWCSIFSDNPNPVKANLINANGVIINSYTIEKPETRINVATLKKGIYLFELKGRSYSLIKE